jgi:hypothetical protein
MAQLSKGTVPQPALSWLTGSGRQDLAQYLTKLDAQVSTNAAGINPKDYGAVGDGVTDDTSALQTAGNAAIANNVPLLIPGNPSGFLVSQNGANPWCLRFTSPIVILGQPGYAIIKPKAGTPTNVSIIQFVGSSDGLRRTVVDGIGILNPNTGTYDGGHALDFQTTGANQLFLRPQITRNYLGTPNSGAGLSINVNNSAANNPNGGFAYALIQDNFSAAGISLNQAGDSIRVVHNNLTHNGSNATVNKGCYVNLITNAGNLQFIGNNGGIDACMLWIDYADTFDCSDNELEHVNQKSLDPIINIKGSGARVQGGSVIDNELTVLGGSAHQPLCLNIDIADNTSVDLNTFQTYTAYVPWVITANAGSAQTLGTKVGGLNKFPTSSTLRLTDNASFTEYDRAKLLSLHTPHLSTGAANSTFYVGSDINTTETFVYFRCPYPAAIIKNLEIYFGNGAPGAGQSYTCTLMKNGVATAVTCTVSGAGSNSAGDITHQASYTLGDQYSVRVVSSVGAAIAQDIQVTMELCQF